MLCRVTSGLVLLAVAVCMLGEEPNDGKVTGTVVAYDGVAVKGARVTADPLDGKMRLTPVRFVETDEQGRFEISHLSWGSYKLFAIKEADGYPNTMLAFYSDNQFPTVTVSRAFPTSKVLLNIGRKAGRILVTAVDANSGRPVPSSAVLRRLDNPKLWVSTSVETATSVLVPAGIDVTLDVTAPGYAKWSLTDTSGKISIFKLKSDDVRKVEVKLQPLPDSAKDLR